jgi:hypothetical protein
VGAKPSYSLTGREKRGKVRIDPDGVFSSWLSVKPSSYTISKNLVAIICFV